MESLLILLYLLSATTISATPIHQSIITTLPPPLSPNQMKALQEMNIPISNAADPCSDPAIQCEESDHFRHVVSLSLQNCPNHLSISAFSLKALSSNLTTLQLINCSFDPNIETPLSLILEYLKNLTTLTITNSNLTEDLPDDWRKSNLLHIDLSNNELKGSIPKSFENLLCLKTLSLASNSLEGNVPNFVRYMPDLRYLNLEGNKFNDNKMCGLGGFLWTTRAVNVMAFMLSLWILFIGCVMLLANLGPY